MILEKIVVPRGLALGLSGDHGRRPRQRRQTELFVKGPLSLAWVRAAMPLPAKALAVGLEIWFRAGLMGSMTVALNLSRMGVERTAAGRGLRALERAGLVGVERRPGRKPVVTIIAIVMVIITVPTERVPGAEVDSVAAARITTAVSS